MNVVSTHIPMDLPAEERVHRNMQIESYRIRVLDSTTGEVTQTYVFSQTPSVDQENTTDVSNRLIYPDDSIHSIKLKLSKAIYDTDDANSVVSPESMYLFTRQWVDASRFTTEQMYQDITRHDSRELTVNRVKVFLDNYSIPYSEEQSSSGSFLNLYLPKNANDLPKFLEQVQEKIIQTKKVLQYFPMGFQYNFRGGEGAKNVPDPTFPINPYRGSVDIMREFQEGIGSSSSAYLLPLDQHLLLRYLPIFQNEIYVCFSKNFAPEISKYYFPRTTSTDAQTLRAIQSNEIRDQTVKFMYEMVERPLQPPLRIEKYITSFTITLMNQLRLPLDILFKNLSTSSTIPAIVYNPGKNKENILRLYSIRTSKNGRRIPVLTKKQISDFCKFSKRNTLIFLLPKDSDIESHDVSVLPEAALASLAYDMDLYIKLDTMGNLHAHGESRVANTDDLDRILAWKLNPLIQELNYFLNKSGYHIQAFRSIYEPNVGIKQMHTRWVIPRRGVTFTEFSILREIPCIRQVFDVYDDVGGVGGLQESTDEEEVSEIVLRYKRMFTESEGQGILIKEFKRKKKPMRAIIEALIVNYRLSFDQARKRVQKYEEEEEDRVIARSPYREYLFPIQIHFEPNLIVLDLFKFCKDCGAGVDSYAPDKEEYVVGRKLQVHKRRKPNQRTPSRMMDTPGYPYMQLLEMYTQSILNIVLNPKKSELPEFCTRIRFEEKNLPEEIALFAEEGIEEEEKVEEEGEEGEEVDEEEEVEEEVEEEEGEEEEEDEDEEEYDDEDEGLLFGGAVVKKKKYKTKLNYLKENDPKLFFTSQKGVAEESYGRICQKDHQPVILNQENYEHTQLIHPDVKTVHYATAPNKKFWYACPKYWCAVTNQILTEDEYKSGVCEGNVEISKYNNPGFEDSTKHPHPEGHCLPCCFKADSDKKKLHKERIQKCQQEEEIIDTSESVPVESVQVETGVVTKKPYKEERNILKYSSSPPLTIHRWGLLPRAVQYLLNMDYSKMVVTTPMSTKILPNHPCMLLYGIEHPKKQSFLGLFAEIYSYKQRQRLQRTVSTQEMRKILSNTLTLDMFLRYQNGSFPSVFQVDSRNPDAPPLVRGIESSNLNSVGRSPDELETYASTLFYKTIQLNDPVQRSFLEKTVAAFENFLAFLQNPQTTIDHTYLWDILADNENELIPGGCNLVILELSEEDGTIDTICPPSELSIFDLRKETFFVLKRDQFYEPIYQYLDVGKGAESLQLLTAESTKGAHSSLGGISPVVTKGFFLESMAPHSSMRRLLELFHSSMHKYCLPIQQNEMGQGLKASNNLTTESTKGAHSSLGTPKKNLSANQIHILLKEIGYTIHSQLWNTHGKIVGFFTSYNGDSMLGVFIPCFPSAILVDAPYPVEYIGSNQPTGFLQTYTKTRARLQNAVKDSDHKIPCEPSYKVIHPSTQLVTGILTETMQYVPVFPFEPPIDDGIAILERPDDIMSDRILSLTVEGDKERITTMLRISLESQFYQVFRSTLRQLLNSYPHQSTKKALLVHVREYTDGQKEGKSDYTHHLREISILLRNMSKNHINFVEYTPEELYRLGTTAIKDCLLDTDNDGGGKENTAMSCRNGKLMIPQYHLLYDSETCGKGAYVPYSLQPKNTRTLQGRRPDEFGNSGQDCNNRNIYYLRLADELLRYPRIQLFMFQPHTFLNISSGMSEYRLLPTEILVLESFLTDEYFQDMIPFNISEYIHQTNHDTAEPASMVGRDIHPILTLEEQTQMIRQVPEDIQQDFVQTECILKKDTRDNWVIGNARNIWKQSFPKNTREITFQSSPPSCTFAVVANILHLSGYTKKVRSEDPLIISRRTTGGGSEEYSGEKSILDIKKILVEAYKSYMDVASTQFSARILYILKMEQHKKKLLASVDLETAIFSEDYFITDLDIWMIASYLEIPVMLISSKTIKMTSTDHWLYLSTHAESSIGNDQEVVDDVSSIYKSIIFVRSPLMFQKEGGMGGSYSLIEMPFTYDKLGPMSTIIEEGIQKSSDHIISLKRFLQRKMVVLPKQR